MLKHRKMAAVLLVVVLLFTACGKKATAVEEPETPKMTVPEDTVVRVDDVMISKSIYEKYLALHTFWYVKDYGKESLEKEYQGTPVREVLKTLVLQQLENQGLVAKYVQDNQYTVDAKLLEEKLAEQKKIIQEDSELSEVYGEVGVDDAFLQYAVKASILQSAYEKMVYEAIEKDTERTKKLFAEYPVEVKAKHILIEKEDVALAVKAKLDAGGVFEDYAKTHSKDAANANKGGDLGYAPRGVWAPEFEAVAFSSPIGTISAPVKTAFGYHIIKVEDIKTIDSLMADKEDEALIETYKRMVFSTVYEEYSNKLMEQTKAKYEMEVYSERLETPATGSGK